MYAVLKSKYLNIRKFFMATVYSLASLKGGVSKTTATINLGGAFATMGLAGANKKVLLIDLDPSGNLTANCGINPASLNKNTSYEVVVGTKAIKDCIIKLEHFDLIPANADLANAPADFLTMYNKSGKQGEKILSQQIWDIGNDYDVIIQDNQPSWNKLLFSSLISSDMVLVPVQPAFFSVVGLGEMIKTIKDVKENFDHDVDYRVFLSMYDERRVLDMESLEIIKKEAGNRLLKTKIRNNISVSEASGNCQNIFQYAPQSIGAEDYLSLAKEIVGI